MRKFLLFFLIAPIYSFGQTLDNYNFDYSKLIYNDVENNNFKNDSIAEGELKKILSIVGNPNRFVVKSNENVQNALAISYKGLRFILFNKEFINQTINITNNYWSKRIIGPVPYTMKGKSTTIYAKIFWDAGNYSYLNPSKTTKLDSIKVIFK